MKRKMVYVGIAYFFGLFFASLFDKAYDFLFAGLILAAGLFLHCAVKLGVKEIAVCGIAFFVSFGYYRIYEINIYEKILRYDEQEVTFYGEITDIKGFGNQTYFAKGQINGKDNTELIFYENDLNVDIGDGISLSGKVAKFKPNREEYYKGLGCYLYFKNLKEYTVHPRFHPVTQAAREYMQKGRERIKADMGSQEAALMLGIVFGDKSGISGGQMTAFYRTGIGYMMSVSGIHIVVISMLLQIVLSRLKLPRIFIYIITQCMLILFVICIGSPASAVRAVVMVTVGTAAVFFNRRADLFNTLCIAAVLLTVPNPFIIGNASFLLSVAGTFAIGIFAPYMTGGLPENTWKGRTVRYLLFHCCVSLAAIPATMLYFEEASVAAPFVNFIVMPFCTAAFVCGFLTVIAGGAAVISTVPLWIGTGCCRFISWISGIIGGMKYSHIPFNGFLKYAIIAAVIFTIAVYAIFRDKKALAKFIAVAVMSISVLNFGYIERENDRLKIAVLGESGNTVLSVMYGGQADIVDISGGGAYLVSEELRRSGIARINTLSIINGGYSDVFQYEENLHYDSVENVFLGASTAVANAEYVMGLEPIYTDFQVFKVDYDQYSITVYDGGVVEVHFGQFTFKCFGVEYDGATGDDVCVAYGKYKPRTIECGQLVVLDDVDLGTADENIYVGKKNYLFETDGIRTGIKEL
ncbi:MAG: ComEC/Rec2 family competence protein [Oscillospiraceae bacterium]|jgi:ComEC/Rec2-related protein|nr:ComEC/Rec2 family competence protein [Oscillospiraceae bacterium]